MNGLSCISHVKIHLHVQRKKLLSETKANIVEKK